MKNLKKGFTLIEMLMVVLIIAILAGVLVVRASSVSIEAKKKAAMADLKTLKVAVEVFYLKHNAFPAGPSITNLETQLTNEINRIVDEVPNDPFGTAYVYNTSGTGEAARFLIYSWGPNKASGNFPRINVDTIDYGEPDDIWVSNCKTNNHQP